MAETEDISRRVAEALAANNEAGQQEIEQEEIEFDAALTWSAGETLAGKDFEKMSGDEIKQATAAIKKMRLPLSEVPTRRYRPNPSGVRVDMRRTLARLFARGRVIFR